MTNTNPFLQNTNAADEAGNGKHRGEPETLITPQREMYRQREQTAQTAAQYAQSAQTAQARQNMQYANAFAANGGQQTGNAQYVANTKPAGAAAKTASSPTGRFSGKMIAVLVGVSLAFGVLGGFGGGVAYGMISRSGSSSSQQQGMQAPGGQQGQSAQGGSGSSNGMPGEPPSGGQGGQNSQGGSNGSSDSNGSGSSGNSGSSNNSGDSSSSSSSGSSWSSQGTDSGTDIA